LHGRVVFNQNIMYLCKQKLENHNVDILMSDSVEAFHAEGFRYIDMYIQLKKE